MKEKRGIWRWLISSHPSMAIISYPIMGWRRNWWVEGSIEYGLKIFMRCDILLDIEFFNDIMLSHKTFSSHHFIARTMTRKWQVSQINEEHDNLMVCFIWLIARWWSDSAGRFVIAGMGSFSQLLFSDEVQTSVLE